MLVTLPEFFAEGLVKIRYHALYMVELCLLNAPKWAPKSLFFNEFVTPILMFLSGRDRLQPLLRLILTKAAGNGTS
jgi:hypothetical protein